MIEILRRSPVIHLPKNKTLNFRNVRPPAKTLSLSAEAVLVNGSDKAVALLFGPENGSISERSVYEAAREAAAKRYEHLCVIGFSIEANARALVVQCEAAVGIKATYAQATPDLLMGDLLKHMRSSQIFSVCGLPDMELISTKDKEKPWCVKLKALDVFDPVEMKTESRTGNDVPAWFLDTDYNGLCFHVSQAFFPRTSAWDNLKKALKAEYEDTVWDHLSGDTSAAFAAGEHKRAAVKVIDDRGNELMVENGLGK